MSDRERAIRIAVDDFFISVGPLIASQITDETATLADLFRSSGSSGVADYGRPFIRKAVETLVKDLTGGVTIAPLWVGILLTGRLKSVSHVAKRFVYWDYPPNGSTLRTAGVLWDKLIDDEAALRRHFAEKLSISKWYETGLLEPAVRHVHLMNLDLISDLSDLGKINPKTTAIGLYGNNSGQMSGMYHGLTISDRPRFDNYLQFLFGSNSGVALYTATPIVSEHNVMKRSIGEVFLAEGAVLLKPAERENLLAGLRHVALGLAARFFFIDQEELESERVRLKKFEERMSMIEKPLRSLANAIDQVRSDAQRINMAVYEPSDSLFKYHRELSQCFTTQSLTISPVLAVNIAHDTTTYAVGDDVTPVAVLYLALGRILGFDREFEKCLTLNELVAFGKARVATIRESDSEGKRSLAFLAKFVFRTILKDPEGMTDLDGAKAKSILLCLKRVIHTPFKPDADNWPILPLMVACLTEETKEFVPISYCTYKGGEKKTEINVPEAVLDKELPRIETLAPPYALHHLLEFIVRLRDSQMKDARAGSSIRSISVHDRRPDNEGRLIVVAIISCIRNGTSDGLVKGVIKGVRGRVHGENLGNPDDMTGDTLWPFVHLLEMGATWKCLRPNDKDDMKIVRSRIKAYNDMLPAGMETVDGKEVVFCLVPRTEEPGTLRVFFCACRAEGDCIKTTLHMGNVKKGAGK